MKQIIAFIILFMVVEIGNTQDNEKRIKFSAGTLNICTSSNMKIKGYDGDEVIIKSLNNQTRYFYNLNKISGKEISASDSSGVKAFGYLSSMGQEKQLEKGLRPLGNKSNNPADNLYLDITEKDGVLTIRDYQPKSMQGITNTFTFNNKYELLIPNTLKLSWNSEDCSKTNSNTFYVTSGSQASELSDFEGDVEISFSYRSITMTDVSGPVIANTLGGNIKAVFSRSSPKKLYSLISNTGYIDVELPPSSNLDLVASGNRILSDIDFEVLSEDITSLSGAKKMHLKLNAGTSKMKLDAGSGSIYLRSNEK